MSAPTTQQSRTGLRELSTDDADLAEALPNAPGRPAWIRLLFGLLPVLTFVVLIGVWWLIVEVASVPTYIAPAPDAVLSRIIEDRSLLWSQSLITMREIALGFGLAILTAIPIGLWIATSVIAKRALYPLLVFTQLVPKIAIAPLFLVWFGFGIESKVLLTTLLTFFPLMLASISGFQILDARLLHLTKSMGASSWQTFRYLRFPAALPVIFSGLKTSATIATTAAIVAEFVGSNSGLGYVLLQATSRLDTDQIFAILLVLTVIGLVLNYVVELVEYLLTPWRRAGRR